MDSRSPGVSLAMSAAGLLPLQHELSVSGGVPGLFFTDLILPAGERRRVNIDTGSVGIVIPHELVVDASGQYYPWAEPTGGVLELIYEPSGDTIAGPVVRLSGLTLGDGSVAIGPVRALAYTQGSGTFMLGVGFGLEAKSQWLTAPANAGGGAAALCLDNPFLAIEGMSRAPGAAFPAAYTLSAAGGASPTAGAVTFGQTPESSSDLRGGAGRRRAAPHGSTACAATAVAASAGPWRRRTAPWRSPGLARCGKHHEPSRASRSAPRAPVAHSLQVAGHGQRCS